MTVLIIYIGIILVATGLPIPEGLPETAFPLDKITHFSIFFLLSFYALKILNRRDAFIVMIGVAIWSELQQFFVPVRSVELPDLLSNLIGGSIPFAIRL